MEEFEVKVDELMEEVIGDFRGHQGSKVDTGDMLDRLKREKETIRVFTEKYNVAAREHFAGQDVDNGALQELLDRKNSEILVRCFNK